MSASEHPKQTVEVLGKKMAYVEIGEGDPIVFQHGILLPPTFGGISCLMWQSRDAVLRWT